MHHKQQRVFVRITMLTAFVAMLLITFAPFSVFLFKEAPHRIDPLVLVCWTTLHSMRVFFIAQFFLACICIRKRFEGLNKKLTSVFKQKLTQLVDSRVGKHFNDLCDVIEIMNETFTVPLIFVFTNILIKSIFAAFAVVNELKLDSDNSSVTLAMCGFALANYLALVVVATWEGSRLKTTATATGKIVTQMMCDGVFDQKQKTDFLFLQSQVRSRNVNVENFLFTINWNILLSVS